MPRPFGADAPPSGHGSSSVLRGHARSGDLVVEFTNVTYTKPQPFVPHEFCPVSKARLSQLEHFSERCSDIRRSYRQKRHLKARKSLPRAM